MYMYSAFYNVNMHDFIYSFLWGGGGAERGGGCHESYTNSYAKNGKAHHASTQLWMS